MWYLLKANIKKCKIIFSILTYFNVGYDKKKSFSPVNWVPWFKSIHKFD